MPLSATHPGFPEMLIRPVSAAVEPYRFESCTGDAADSSAQAVRAGVSDVRLEVFVGEQDVPFALEIDACDDLACPAGISFEERTRLLKEDHEKFHTLVDASLRRHFNVVKELVARGTYFFDYGNSFMKAIYDSGVKSEHFFEKSGSCFFEGVKNLDRVFYVDDRDRKSVV